MASLARTGLVLGALMLAWGCGGSEGEVVVFNPPDGLPVEAYFGMDAADVDGDGYADLVAASHYSDGAGGTEDRLNVFLQDRANPGNFRPARRQVFDSDAGQYWDLYAVDLKLNGLPDIVARPVTGTGLVIFAQDPAAPGTYLAPVHHDPAGASNHWYLDDIAVGDVDNDAYADVVVTAADDVILYRQRGGSPGSFEPGVRIAEGSGALVVADVSGDGAHDLVTFRATSNNDGIPLERDILVYLRDTSRDVAYFPPIGIPLDYGGGGLGVADLNADGLADIVMNGARGETGGVRGRLRIYRQLLGNRFVELEPIRTGGDRLPAKQAIADLDGDGDLEIVVSYRTAAIDPNQVEIFTQLPSGDYVSGALLDIPDDRALWNPELFSLQIADLNSDNRPDIAVSTYELFVFFQHAGPATGFDVATRIAGQR